MFWEIRYNFYLLTFLLTPWSRVLLEKLTGLQLVKKFPAFYGTRKFITAFTSARHLSLSGASSIQSIPLHPTSWRSILILSCHLRCCNEDVCSICGLILADKNWSTWKCTTFPLYPPKIWHRLAKDRPQASAVGDRKLVTILWSWHVLEDWNLAELYIQTRFLPHRQQISFVESNGLTILRIIIAVCSVVTSYLCTMYEYNY